MLCPSQATQCSSAAVFCVSMKAALCLGNALPHEPLPWRCGAKLSRAVPQLCGSEQRPCGAYPVHAVAVRVASVLCRRGANLGRGRALLSRCGCDHIRALPCRSETLPCRASAQPCCALLSHCGAKRCNALAPLCSAIRCPRCAFLRRPLPQLCAAYLSDAIATLACAAAAPRNAVPRHRVAPLSRR